MNFSSLDRYLESLLDYGFPLYDCTVHVRGHEVYRRRGGMVGVPHSLYYIYSAGKVVTCAAAMQLLERGAFLLDTPVSHFLPEFGEMKIAEKQPDGTTTLRTAETPVTVRHLFTMTAGMNYAFDTPAITAVLDAQGEKASTREIVRAIAETPLSFEPGTRWQYSLCHDVLACVVEAASGMRFSEYVKKNIFDPLGMKDSTFSPAPVSGPMTPMYRFIPERGGAVRSDEQPRWRIAQYESGGGGMVSTAEDYILFADAMANGGTGAGGARILSPATIDLMRTNQLSAEQRSSMTWTQLRGYGYGLGVRTMIDRAAGGSIGPLGEFGWGGAAGALTYIVPETGTAVYLAQHTLNPQEGKVLPELRNVVFAALA